MEIRGILVLRGQAPHQYREVYRNNHTMSTKCQYQAAHSKPTRWRLLLLNWLKRFKDTKRNKDPIRTWIPWNPVAIKKLDPKEVSVIVNGPEMYSNPWSIEKMAPKRIVVLRERVVELKFFSNIS